MKTVLAHLSCLVLVLQASCTALRARDLATLSGRHHERVMSLAWRADGARIASASFDGTVVVRDAASGKVVETFNASSPYVVDVQWSADGALLASTSHQAVDVFDGETGARLTTIGTTIGTKEPPRFGPAALLALATYDGRILVLDARSGHERAVLHGHTGEVSSLSWSPDRRTLMSGSWDHTVRLWDAQTFVQKDVFEAAGVGNLEVRWSSSGRFASWYVSVVRDLEFYDAESGARTRIETAPVVAAEWKPGEDTVAMGLAGGAVELHRALSAAAESGFMCGTFPDTLAWSPDGRFLAVLQFASGRLCIFDAAHGSLSNVHVASGPLIALAWSPDSDRLAVAGYDGKVRVLTLGR